jgi:hypothetical protein
MENDDPRQFESERSSNFGSQSQIPRLLANPTVGEVIHEKLKEEIFGKIAKNLKWLEVLHRLSSSALQSSGESEEILGLLLERILSAEKSFATAFVPILTYFYSHKYEVSEIFGKYVAASYDLARVMNTTALVTEEFWQETLPDEAARDYVDSEKRIAEILVPKKDEKPNDLSIISRYMYVSARNLTANVEQLATVFKDDPDVTSFVSLLQPRIIQIEDGSLTLFKYLNKRDRAVGEESKISLIALKTGEASRKKWAWEGRINLTQPVVLGRPSC